MVKKELSVGEPTIKNKKTKKKHWKLNIRFNLFESWSFWCYLQMGTDEFTITFVFVWRSSH